MILIIDIFAKAKPMEMIESCSTREIIVTTFQIDTRTPREYYLKCWNTIIYILEFLLPIGILVDLIYDEYLAIIFSMEPHSKIEKRRIEKIDTIS